MALQISVTATQFGNDVVFPEAYIRVLEGTVRRNADEAGNTIHIVEGQCLVYANAQAAADGKNPVANFGFRYPCPVTMDMNPVAWIYTQLKTEESLSNAIDV
jgi:hypothetical protein